MSGHPTDQFRPVPGQKNCRAALEGANPSTCLHLAQPTRVRNRISKLGRAGFSSGSGGLDVPKAASGRSVDLATVSRQPSQFLLRLFEATRGDGIRGLQAILKALLRRHGFRCLDCREVI